MKRVGIIGVGEYLPKKVLTNADLEKMVDTSDEWITTRTGIKERRLVSGGEATSDMAARAAEHAIKDAGISAADIDLIIVTTITPDMQFPATACFVQAKLGAKNAICFDLSAACAGFVYGIITAQQFISQDTSKKALVIGAETLSSITDWEDRNTCVLFGDGAGAVVLSGVESGGILAHYLGSNGNLTDLLKVPGGGSRNPTSLKTVNQKLHFTKMQGNELFKLAVTLMTKAAKEVLKKANLKFSDIDIVIPHQANSRIIMAMAKKLGLTEEQVYLNIEKYGNMSSASTATALCEAVKDGKIKKKDVVLLDAFGAGLVWGACIIEW